MKATSFIIILSIVIMLLPVVGLPGFFRDILCASSALIIFLLAIFIAKQNRQTEKDYIPIEDSN